MIQKARLDILDIPLDDSAAGNREDNPQEKGTERSDETSMGLLHFVINRINALIFINKFMLLSIFGGILLLGVISGLWTILSRKGTVEKQGSGISPPAASSALYSGTRLDGFVVDVKGDGGNIRVLICDLVLEPVHGQAVKGVESRIDIRQTIYRILRAREVAQLMAPEGRSALKKEIQAEMIRLLGDGKVKDVYFTRYMVL
jgi:flagellar basal body-associated protein FliL